MTGVTETGFEPKVNDEIIEDINTRAKSAEYFGEDFPITPDSVFGIHTGVLSASISDTWALAQAVAAQQNRDTATGIYLDYLARIIGLSRLGESGSLGLLKFTGLAGTTVAQFFPVADLERRNVLTQESLTLNRTECYESTFSVKTVTDEESYSVTINGVSYSYTSLVDTSAEDIINGLDNAIVVSGQNLVTSTVVEGSTDEEWRLVITYGTTTNELYTTNSSNMSLSTVGSLVLGESVSAGALVFETNTINTLVGNNVGITAVTNPSDFTIGRSEETDEELRQRMTDREQSTGTATKPSIEASISEISGVTSVIIEENITMLTNANGIPAKSYETFVSGGSLESIAQVVWDTKPAGISTHGDITRPVVDKNGDTQSVSFSRPTESYAHMKVTYSLNSEEVTPTDAEGAMRDAAVAAGNSMYQGEDYEATKFYGPLYTVQGVYISGIEIAVTPNALDTPTYQTALIPVASTEKLLFDTVRVEIEGA